MRHIDVGRPDKAVPRRRPGHDGKGGRCVRGEAPSLKGRGARAAVGLMAATFGAAPAGTTSFYLNEQSIKAAGRAFSGEAADQGPEQLWWNPAAIAGAEHVAGAIGAALILPQAKVRDIDSRILRPGRPSAPVGGDPRPANPAKSGVLPSGAVAVPLTDRVAIGLAVASPYSFTTDYAADSWTRYLADRTSLLTVDLQPSVAVKLTERLRVGVAANVEYVDATLAKRLPNLSPALPDGRQALKGHGWDVGWSAGAQLVGGWLSVGVSYKSGIRHKLDGTVAVGGLLGPLAGANGRIATSASFRTPWQAIGAVRLAATDALTLNAQVTRFGWSGFDRIRLSLPAGAFVPEDYRDTWTVAAGADWRLSPGWSLRGGVYRDQTPTRDGRRDPNVPDANRTAVALGASRRLSDAITIDLAAEYLFFDRSSIDRGTVDFAGTPVATTIVSNGELAAAHAVILGLGGRFSF